MIINYFWPVLAVSFAFIISEAFLARILIVFAMSTSTKEAIIASFGSLAELILSKVKFIYKKAYYVLQIY